MPPRRAFSAPLFRATDRQLFSNRAGFDGRSALRQSRPDGFSPQQLSEGASCRTVRRLHPPKLLPMILDCTESIEFVAITPVILQSAGKPPRNGIRLGSSQHDGRPTPRYHIPETETAGTMPNSRFNQLKIRWYTAVFRGLRSVRLPAVRESSEGDSLSCALR